MEEKPILIKGGLSCDDRGIVSFVNDFSLDNIKRKYTVRNHKKDYIRGFHAHKHEKKWVEVLVGSAYIICYKVENWKSGGADSQNIYKFTLSEYSPSILYIPEGYANGFKSLDDNTVLQFYSNLSIKESLGDDYRFHWAGQNDDFKLAWADNYR